MALKNERQSRLYELHRWKMHDQAVRGLFLLNGGAAVALLAFLQAIWNLDKGMARYVVFGIGFVTLGLVLAAVSNYVRFQASGRWEFQEPSRFKWLYISYSVQFASLGMFVIAVVVLLAGALRTL